MNKAPSGACYQTIGSMVFLNYQHAVAKGK
jgi:hypothetical protein